MDNRTSTGVEHVETVVIGAGQAGLSAGYHLARLGRDFVILDAGARVGDNWRSHWDSLRLYSPRKAAGLPGMRFPGAAFGYPTKDEMADFLEAYATRFELPVRGEVRVTRLSRSGDRFVVQLPFTPHLAEEAWARLGGEGMVVDAPWPAYDAALAADDELILPCRSTASGAARCGSPLARLRPRSRRSPFPTTTCGATLRA